MLSPTKKIVEFKDFTRLLSDFQYFTKQFNFQGLFKKAPSLCEPCLCLLGSFSSFLSSADFFQIIFFEKFFQEYHQCQTVWIQIRPNILLGLIWVQTVCQGHQQMALVGKKFKDAWLKSQAPRPPKYVTYILVKSSNRPRVFLPILEKAIKTISVSFTFRNRPAYQSWITENC